MKRKPAKRKARTFIARVYGADGTRKHITTSNFVKLKFPTWMCPSIYGDGIVIRFTEVLPSRKGKR